MGVIIAAPSAMAVIVAVAKGGFNAIVGTAISVSLLPPVVNCGVCFGMGIVSLLSDKISHNPGGHYFHVGLVISWIIYYSTVSIICRFRYLIQFFNRYHWLYGFRILPQL